MSQVRVDDFQTRRQHLAKLSEKELEERFWALAEKVVEPMVELAKTHTSPSIERSVLLRMGFSSIESKAIVDKVMDRGLMGKGAGHIVYLTAKNHNLDIRKAGLELAEGNPELWQDIERIFKGGNGHETNA